MVEVRSTHYLHFTLSNEMKQVMDFPGFVHSVGFRQKQKWKMDQAFALIRALHIQIWPIGLMIFRMSGIQIRQMSPRFEPRTTNTAAR